MCLDTCSWIKIKIISKGLGIDLRDILEEFDICITHELNAELKYYLSDFIDTKKLKVYPVQKSKTKYYEKLGFDSADASIIVLSNEIDIFTITEDGELLTYLINFDIKAIQLSEFFLTLVNLDYLDKSSVYNLFKFLRERRNIRKKRYGKLKKALTEIR